MEVSPQQLFQIIGSQHVKIGMQEALIESLTKENKELKEKNGSST